MRSPTQGADCKGRPRVPRVGESVAGAPFSADNTADASMLLVLVFRSGGIERAVNEDHFVVFVRETSRRHSRPEWTCVLRAIKRGDFARGNFDLGDQPRFVNSRRRARVEDQESIVG